MKILIIGGVAGGATAAARMRRDTENAEIILLEKGDYISYANCGLPYYIGGVITDRNRLFVQTAEAFGHRFNIDVRTGHEATAINLAGKKVTVKKRDGSEYVETYDKLLLSPGASPVRPSLPGIDDKAIFTLRNVDDTDKIKTYIATHNVRRAVIVGGGFIGLEMAENLVSVGADVDVVDMADQVMAPIDYSMAALVHEHLLQKGVGLYLSQSVESFERVNGALTVYMKSGASLTADIVILSIGVRAETALAKDAGLKIGEARGIYVNEYLQTSDKDVYAVGDAIEFPHPLTKKPWMNFLAGPANRQARIVADNIMFGNKLKYEGSIGTSVAKVFDLTVAATGLPAKRLKQMGIPCLSATVHPMSHAGYYPGASIMSIKITFSPDDGRLYGAQIVGREGVDKRIDEYAYVIKTEGTVYDLTRIEHAYAPPFSSAKDPVAVSGYVAVNILSGKMFPLYWRELKETDINKVTLIDVRTNDEFALGAIDGAINIPVDDLRTHIGQIPKDKPVWLYCGVGLRGYLASNILKDKGYDDVHNLIGGYKTYKAATAKISLPCESDRHDICNIGCNDSVKEVADETLLIDACGLQCPGPIIKLKEGVEKLPEGKHVEIRATDAGFLRDVEAWCKMTGNILLSKNVKDGTYCVVVEKGKTSGDNVMKQEPLSLGKGKTLILFSDDLDKVLATFVLANGAAATGQKVSIFFTFWGLNAIKKEYKPKVVKDLFGKMFGIMMPQNSHKLKLSKMNMGGLGAKMMRYVMRKKGVDSLEKLRQTAIDNGVEFIACQMSMDVMGVKREELLDCVTVGGVATYMERADNSNVNLFV